MTASASLSPISGNTLKLSLQAMRAKPLPPPTGTPLAGKTALVTGSNSGIGLECNRQFLELGLSRLIMAVRTPARGEAVAVPLRKAFPQARIEVWTLDMGDYASIQAFARRCETDLERLDIAVLNAATIHIDFIKNAHTGHEEMFQINYLSTALLAILLLPALKPKKGVEGSMSSGVPAPGRLTIVSSGLSLTSAFSNHAADPLIPSFNSSHGWGVAAVNERYSVTKTLLVMFVQKASEYVRSTDVVINAVDPGLVKDTGLHRNVKGVGRAFMGAIKMAAGRTMEQGAWTYVDAAVVKDESSHGSFVMDWKICPYVCR